jgi:hypothetical protein
MGCFQSKQVEQEPTTPNAMPTQNITIQPLKIAHQEGNIRYRMPTMRRRKTGSKLVDEAPPPAPVMQPS